MTITDEQLSFAPHPLLTISALVLSLAAVAFSGFVYLQRPEEASLTELKDRIAANEKAVRDLSGDSSVDDLASTLGEAFAVIGTRLATIERDANAAMTMADGAQAAAEEAYSRADEIEENLGICLYAQESEFRYTYWSGIALFGNEYMYRCEY